MAKLPLELLSSCIHLSLTKNWTGSGTSQSDWTGNLTLHFVHTQDFFPGVVTRKSKETILLLSPPSERNKQRDGECKKQHALLDRSADLVHAEHVHV